VDEPQFMREKDVAALLALKPFTLRQWRRKGEGPAFIRVGPRTIRYEASAVEEFIEWGRKMAGYGRKEKEAQRE
jgi:predicted DNA-binding transcriptional regulator AlpA